MKNLQLLQRMCGKKAMTNVAIVSTMWSLVGEKEGTRREEELKRDVWNDMVHDGCGIERFDNTFDSAWNIVGNMMKKNSDTDLLLQDEMTGSDPKALGETSAGSYLKEAMGRVPKSLLRRIRKSFRW
jgi:hypothetical protein